MSDREIAYAQAKVSNIRVTRPLDIMAYRSIRRGHWPLFLRLFRTSSRHCGRRQAGISLGGIRPPQYAASMPNLYRRVGHEYWV